MNSKSRKIIFLMMYIKFKKKIKGVLKIFYSLYLRLLFYFISKRASQYKIVINYKKNNHNLLSKLCDKY